MNQSNLQRIHTHHRLGVILAITEFTFLFIFFLESGLIEETKMGLTLFLWACSALLLPVPLATGLTLKESLKFFAFSLPLFFLFGLIALIIPTQLVFCAISILAIVWIAVLSLLIKRKPEVFDLKPRINPSIFLETIIIFGLSFLLSYITLLLKLIDTVISSLSLYSNYLLLGLMFSFVISIITIGLRFFIKKR